MTRLKVVMEIEFSELPDEVRDDLADGWNFRADEDNEIADDLDTVPRLSEATKGELVEATRDFFDGLADYDMQSELWAGSSFYGFISAFDIKSIEAL